MTYKNILLDFDDTIVDFYDAEEKAFYNMSKHYRHFPSEQDFQHFRKVNQAHWEAFQKNELTKEQVLSHRFTNYFNDYHIKVDGKEADEIFRDELAKAPLKFFDQTIETINQLKNKHSLYIVTNGVTITQQRRIAQTNFNDKFNGIFISEQTGYQKPMPEFFDYIFNKIGDLNREETIIVGDSLTSDVRGGLNANIKTCWFNYREKENNSNIQPHYEISNLTELIDIVE
ncbi:YjjG family noncanonical pyrimidine nucleotidase [Staphylococcus capitis]|uniref:YjjG family noncanonical pyrimidine nucleotidase n=1 Tax=Staphylococcus capitis TaxID=29388 RepID=UPI000CD218AD|nr:YjjG family noncanonical pyrimidine nucleotidase [Staphylococcus capitis]PNZ76596.1 noncanonical pyrimidine nucleotidase, YjjG family [Staphylococcus capitis subsp. capitis]GGI35172.1 noncanonical pyrimidine nucleotidase, YjjG family protein [Staphylococcus capitis]VTR17591.1 HAD superfamily hydrolase [Staphylococcus capitis]